MSSNVSSNLAAVRRRASRAWTASLGAFALALALPSLAQFIPTETLVSPNPGLVDAEFSQSRAKIVWTDSVGNLWLANVNRNTGAFEPVSGKGQQIATNTVFGLNEFYWNGPEWLSTANGDQIFYSYYLPGKARIAANTRMAVAVQDATGAWISQTLSPNLPRMAHIASKDAGDPNPHIKYLDPKLNQYVRDVGDPATERILPFIPPSTKSWRFAQGLRALLYALPVGGRQQIFQYLLDTRVSEQLTFDEGDKDLDRTVPWMWQAPEFGNDFVLSTVVDGSELRVYRRLPGPGGALQWTPIYSNRLPAGSSAGSPEIFTYQGRSYVFMAVYVSPNTFPTEIWLSNIDSTNPMLRRVSDNTLPRVRNDPELFITTTGPYIYYNRYDYSIDPTGEHPLCSACSEGVYRADTGSGRNRPRRLFRARAPRPRACRGRRRGRTGRGRRNRALSWRDGREPRLAPPARRICRRRRFRADGPCLEWASIHRRRSWTGRTAAIHRRSSRPCTMPPRPGRGGARRGHRGLLDSSRHRPAGRGPPPGHAGACHLGVSSPGLKRGGGIGEPFARGADFR
jgi:hypothetical protein